MIEFKKKPDKEEDIKELLNPIVRKWFFSKFEKFSLPQLFGVMEIHKRNNILISAPTGATKCVTPDTSILVDLNNNTRLLKGKELIEIAENKGKLVAKMGKNGKLYHVPHLKTYSLLKDEIKKSRALVYFEDCDDTLLKIKIEYGREVKISKDHPLLVETDEGGRWISASKIKKGDKIAVPRNIELSEKEIILDYKKALENLKKKADIVITYDIFKKLKNKTQKFTDFSLLNRGDLYNLKVLLQLSYSKISRDISISNTVLYNLFNFKTNFKRNILYNYFKKKCKNIKFENNRLIVKNKSTRIYSFKYPFKIDIRIVRWLAFILAEGLIGDYKPGTFLIVSQKKRIQLLNEFLKTSKEVFDIKFRKKNEMDYVYGSTLFCYFIVDLFGIKMGRGRNVPLPDWLLEAEKEIKINFLNMFFSLEATIPSKGNSIELSQSNINKIEVINYLLLGLGIFPSVSKKIRAATNTKEKIKREYYSLSINKIRHLTSFLNLIDIDHQNRRLLENHTKGKTSGEYVEKHKFDYKKISKLSSLYENYDSYLDDFGPIYEVTRRNNYITETALLNLVGFLLFGFKGKKDADNLREIALNKISQDICWLKVKEIKKFKYRGKVVDLTVPNVHNFIGGYGGIYLHNTLTAFLSILNELIDSAEKGVLQDKVYCVYNSPLKALNNDIYVNLEQPLKEMEELAGKKFGIRIAVRTGDTPQAERAKMLKNPPHLLITTPESLALLLSSPKFKEHLKQIDYCITDETHALFDNKRGVHLSLSLERLQALSRHMMRIGLSATQAPLDQIAQCLVGNNRECKVIDVQFIKDLDLKVLSPVDNLIESTHNDMHNKMYNLIHDLIQNHKTTLIFTNTRSGTERVVHNLKEKFSKHYNDVNIGAHHGSLSRSHRFRIEDDLRKGKLRCVVTSTALELGIDIGYIDLVILLGSPKSVARCLQRTGRSAHKLHEKTKGRLIVLDRDDLIECSVLLKSAIEKKIDKIHIPSNCLDVLSQQIFGIAISSRIHINDLYKLIKKSYCYRNLTREDFMDVIDYLSGKFVSLEDRHIYAKIWYDEETGMVGRKGRLARVLYMTNIGTIPDETHVVVKVGDRVIGVIDEAFLERLRPNDIFVLGGTTYQFRHSKGMVAQVVETPLRPPTVPSWFSEMLPLSFDLAMDIQRFRKLMEQRLNKPKKDVIKFIHDYLYVDDNTANAIYEYFKEQHLFMEIPSSEKIIVENYADEKGKRFTVFHTLFGRRVNDALSRCVAYAIARTQHRDVEIGITDNGFYLSSNKKINVMSAFRLLKSENLGLVLVNAIDRSEVLKRRFRHCAARALMILRSYKGKQKKVGRQQVSSMILLNAVKRLSNNFSILKEARREVLEDLMDIENAINILKWIEDGKIKVKEIETDIPSPFALNLLAQGYTDIMKIGDKQEFLKKMHKYTMARIALKKNAVF